MATRQFTFSLDPEEGLANTLSWDGLAMDGNTDGKAITCAYFPRTKGSTLNVLQEQMLIGGLSLDAMWRTFERTQGKDDESDFTATAILNNFEPTIEGGRPTDNKRFFKLEFPRINPLSKTSVTIDFAVDEINPEDGVSAWNSLDEVSGSHIAGIPSGIGRSMNIRIRDTGDINLNDATFDGVIVHYYQMGVRHEA